jgi:hypothetical protein
LAAFLFSDCEDFSDRNHGNSPPLRRRATTPVRAQFCCSQGLRSLCNNQRNFVDCTVGRQRHLPHLRRLAISYFAYPALPLHFVQGERTGLRCSAPPALHYGSQSEKHDPQSRNYESPITSHDLLTCRSQIDRDKTGAPEARHNVAQPVRAGIGGNRNPEHRRCDT